MDDVKFKVYVQCAECASNNVNTSVWANYGEGFIEFSCNNCENKPSQSVNNDELNRLIYKSKEEN